MMKKETIVTKDETIVTKIDECVIYFKIIENIESRIIKWNTLIKFCHDMLRFKLFSVEWPNGLEIIKPCIKHETH